MRDARTDSELREQAEFERQQKRQRVARIRQEAKDNPDLPVSALCERFGEPAEFISDVIGGVSPERKENAYLGYRRHHDGKRRRSA